MIHNLVLDDNLLHYLAAVQRPHDKLSVELRELTGQLPLHTMLVPAEQGRLLGLLVSLMQARTVLEIGVFTGYSTLCMARALPADGRVIALDISAEWTSLGERYWEKAGVRDRIQLELHPALHTLDQLLDDAAGTVELAFIDADKENYSLYYERCLRLLRPGGLIVLDNTLWSGKVAQPDEQDPETTALRAINASVRDDDRVDAVVLPVFDGLTLARKR